VKWLSILWQLMRDVLLTSFGVWIIWKEVEAAVPNTALLVVALGCIAPAARTAVATILSGPGSSSESPAPQEELPSPPSPPEGGGTGE
jgi:hypothetical protein